MVSWSAVCHLSQLQQQLVTPKHTGSSSTVQKTEQLLKQMQTQGVSGSGRGSHSRRLPQTQQQQQQQQEWELLASPLH
jgi:hypothetical protein